MSKRKVRRVNEETYDISLHNEIFIPDVSIKYGAYKENLIEDSSSQSDHDEQKADIHEVVINNQDDGYDIIDNDVGMMTLDDYLEPLEDDNVIYVEPIFHDNDFDDSFIFGDGLIISTNDSNINIDDEVDVLLFEDSTLTLKQICRYKKVLKCTQNLGDVTFSIIVGSILSFLPTRNALVKYIDQHPTLYNIISKIDKLSDVRNCCRVYKFNLCDESKCIIPHQSINNDSCVCIHTKKKKQSFHYLPIRDRILKLLNSDIHHFFHTSEFVTKPVGEEVINFNVKILLNF